MWLAALFFSIFCLSIACCFFLFSWLKRKLSYWKDLGVKQCEPKYIFRDYKALLSQSCNETDIIDNIYKMFKSEKYVGLYFFWKPYLLVKDPYLIKNIFQNDFDYFTDHGQVCTCEGSDSLLHSLLFANGDEWKTFRAVFGQMFTPSKLKGMIGSIVEILSNEIIPQLDTKASPPKSERAQDVYVTKTVEDFVTIAITKVLIGLDIDSPESRFVEMGRKFIYPSRWKIVKYIIFRLMPSLSKCLRFRIIDMEVNRYFNAVAKNLMMAKAEKKNYGYDLLSFLQKCKSGEIKKLEGVSDNFIAAHIFIFYIAGATTTSNALSYALFELSRNQDVQDKVREEIAKVAEEEGQNICYDFVRKLTYMEKVLHEVNRMHPPIGLLPRVSNKDYKIDENLNLPGGMTIVVPCRAIHFDPLYFPDPQTFNPDRYSPEVPWTWMPFGKGPRECIGRRFSELTIKAALAMIVRRYDILPSPKMVMPIKCDTKSILLINRPIDGIWVQLKRR